MPYVITDHKVKYGGRIYAAGQKIKVEEEHIRLIPGAVAVDGRSGKPKEALEPPPPYNGHKSKGVGQ